MPGLLRQVTGHGGWKEIAPPASGSMSVLPWVPSAGPGTPVPVVISSWHSRVCGLCRGDPRCLLLSPMSQEPRVLVLRPGAWGCFPRGGRAGASAEPHVPVGPSEVPPNGSTALCCASSSRCVCPQRLAEGVCARPAR